MPPIYTGPNAGPTKPAGASELNQDGTVAKQGAQYQEGAIFTPWGRLEPLLSPEQLKSRFLMGVPMLLRIKDPETGKPFRITDEMLKDYIEIAVSVAEEETSTTIMPTQFVEKHPFDRLDFQQFGYFKLPRRPIASIESLNVTLADGSVIFQFPTIWIETGNLITGQVNIVPLAFQNLEAGTGVVGGPGGGGGSAVYFNALWGRPWVAALFGITYTAGWKDGLLPKIVNDLIGVIATMRVLSQIAAAYALFTSTSLGLDGMSQSVSTPGPARFQVRIGELKEERALLVKKIKKITGTKLVTGTV